MSEPRMVRLYLCTRRTCQHVFPDDEMAWTRGNSGDGKCPECGCKVHCALNPDGILSKGGYENWQNFDLATLPGIPTDPKAGKRVKAGIAALVARLAGGTPAEALAWAESMRVPGMWLLNTPMMQISVVRQGRRWMTQNISKTFPTREAAQQAAVARAVELVEATLAILKP